jgi:hypothetical protein
MNEELVAEIRAAAASLVTSAGAAENGELAAAEIGIEDALFRVQSVLSRVQSILTSPPPEPTPKPGDDPSPN